jgi:tetratricopeptide repeat protein 21B
VIVDLDKASARALYVLSNFALWTGDTKASKEFIKRLKRTDKNFPGQAALRGWWELMTGQTKPDFFEEFSGVSANDLEAQLVKAKYFQMRAANKESVEVYNTVIASHPEYLPALSEKASVFVHMGDWSQALETAQRVLAADASDVDAQKVVVCAGLATEASFSEAASGARELLVLARRVEPKSARLLISVSQPIARLACRSREVLKETLALVEAAAKISPRDASVQVELGFQRFLMGDITGASQAYQRAMDLDDANAAALYGIIRCLIAGDKLEDADQQIEFLQSTSSQTTMAAQPIVPLMAAELAQKKRAGKDGDVVGLVDKAVAAHLALVRRPAHDADAVTALNPEFLMDVAQLYVAQASLDPADLNEATSAVLGKAAEVLNVLRARVPACIPALLLLGRCRYALGQKDEGLRLINQCTSLDASNPEVHITLAQIYVSQGATQQALASLEQALAYDFAVRELPLYNLIRALALEEQGNAAEAVRLLEATMSAPGVRQVARPEQLAKSRYADVPLQVRVSIFVKLAHLHAKLGHNVEASKIMSDAANEFNGTAEERRVAIASCEVSLERGDVEKAIETLSRVPKDDPYYVRARTTLARVYLQHRGDRRSYARVYEELTREMPSVANFTASAEAFMRISEPDLAIRAYEAALRLSPKDAELTSKIGRVLVSTHDYKRAIDFYEKGCRADAADLVLRRDLAELYLRLRQYEDCQKILVEALKNRRPEQADDPTSLVQEVAMLALLAEVTERTGKATTAMELLGKAVAKQTSLIARLRNDKPELVEQQRKQAAALCVKLAEAQAAQRQPEEAARSYNDALRYSEDSPEARVALARLALAQGSLDQCQEHCLTLLRHDPASEEATMLLAEVMARREEHQTALYHFEQLLETKPDNYSALARLLVLLRRAGRLEEAGPALIARAEASPRSSLDPGFHYAKGLYLRYSSDPLGALKEFNLARKDPEWGERTLRAMIEIYLVTDGVDLWEEAEEGRKETVDRIRSAAKLLDEFALMGLATRTARNTHAWLQGQLLLASGSGPEHDRAVELFTQMLTDDRDSIPGLLGLAVSHMLKKDSSKARNHLKRLAKMDYNYEFADEFERGYLLLAEIYIDLGKLDQAIALVKSALQHNASCAKAWELKGKIEEKDLAYKDAAESYEKAFALARERSAPIGYKLAFNMLKASRHLEAIKISHKVLALNPDYPKIKKEILGPARNNLRK